MGATLKTVWLFIRRWWWAFLAALLALIWWWISGGEENRYPAPQFVNTAKAKAERADLEAKIELAKKKGATETQVAELDKIMEIENGEERRKRLSEKLNELFGGRS